MLDSHAYSFEPIDNDVQSATIGSCNAGLDLGMVLELDCCRSISGSKYSFYHPLVVDDFILRVCAAVSMQASSPFGGNVQLSSQSTKANNAGSSNQLLKSFYVPQAFIKSPSVFYPPTPVAPTQATTSTTTSSTSNLPDYSRMYLVHIYEGGNILDASKDRRFSQCEWTKSYTNNGLITLAELKRLVMDLRRLSAKNRGSRPTTRTL